MSRAKTHPPNWQTISESLESEPSAWKADTHHMRHASGQELRISNGWTCLSAGRESVTGVQLGVAGRWRVWRAFKRWKRWQVRRVLREGSRS